MVNLFITGSIHTNAGERISVNIAEALPYDGVITRLEDLIVAHGHERKELGNMRVNIVWKSSPIGYNGANFVRPGAPKKGGFSLEKLVPKKQGIPSISQIADNVRRFNDSRPTMAQVEENCKRWANMGLKVKDLS